MLGIPLGLLAANATEWAVHKHVLHGLGRHKSSLWAFHWHEHHRNVRKHQQQRLRHEVRGRVQHRRRERRRVHLADVRDDGLDDVVRRTVWHQPRGQLLQLRGLERDEVQRLQRPAVRHSIGAACPGIDADHFRGQPVAARGPAPVRCLEKKQTKGFYQGEH